jgi:hypothetical protein
LDAAHYGFSPSIRPNDESPVRKLIVILATVTVAPLSVIVDE